MAKMRYTKDDLAKGKVIEAGWYPSEVVGYTQKPAGKDAKNPGSLNTTFEFRFLEGAKSEKDGDLTGHKVYRLFNETGMGFAASFIEVVTGAPPNSEGGDFDPDEAKGKKMMVYVSVGMDNKNRPRNEVEDFRPIG